MVGEVSAEAAEGAVVGEVSADAAAGAGAGSVATAVGLSSAGGTADGAGAGVGLGAVAGRALSSSDMRARYRPEMAEKPETSRHGKRSPALLGPPRATLVDRARRRARGRARGRRDGSAYRTST
jgi:hypothetical protein